MKNRKITGVLLFGSGTWVQDERALDLCGYKETYGVGGGVDEHTQGERSRKCYFGQVSPEGSGVWGASGEVVDLRRKTRDNSTRGF